MNGVDLPYADKGTRRQYQLDWWHRNRAAWLAANGPCVRCGSDKDLEVDHVDPATKVDHAVWSWSMKRRLEELAKCQVLCGECHQRKTSEENRRPTVHGRVTTYDKRGCRCEPCTTVKLIYKAGGRAALERYYGELADSDSPPSWFAEYLDATAESHSGAIGAHLVSST